MSGNQPINYQSKLAYEKEHIPSAINLPHKDIRFNGVKDLDKRKTYICYCAGIGCNALKMAGKVT